MIVVIAVFSLLPMPTTGQTSSVDQFARVTDAMLQNPAASDWLMWRRTLDGWGV
jgi:hypothetical protein